MSTAAGSLGVADVSIVASIDVCAGWRRRGVEITGT